MTLAEQVCTGASDTWALKSCHTYYYQYYLQRAGLLLNTRL